MAKLTFIFSSMNSGKTLALLTKNFMLREKGYNTLLIKPAIDDRTTTISSRIGLEASCISIDKDASVLEQVYRNKGISTYENIDYVLVDEAQFLTKEQAWELSELVDYYNVNVICYGLKLSWKGEFFDGSKALMEIADELQQMDSFCKETGNPALFHHKLGGSDDAVETGYEDLYDTVSRKVWKEKNNK